MRPRIFIGSATESLPYARAVQMNLDREFETRNWDQGVSVLGEHFLDSLVKQVARTDYGVFVCTPDDVSVIRNKKVSITRPNVLFELGLFMGALGRDSCFWILPKTGVELPSDLASLTAATYNPDHTGDLQERLGPACSRIITHIQAKEQETYGRATIPDVSGRWLTLFIEDDQDGKGPHITKDEVNLIQNGRKISGESQCISYQRDEVSYLTGELIENTISGSFLYGEVYKTGAGNFHIGLDRSLKWMEGYSSWVNYPDKKIASSKYIWFRGAAKSLKTLEEKALSELNQFIRSSS